jgi:hypothetical protein
MAGKSITPPRNRVRSPSLIPRRSRHSGREVVIERVVEKASASIVYPILTHTNYSEWALVMRVNLQAVGLWGAINKGSGDYRDDWYALAEDERFSARTEAGSSIQRNLPSIVGNMVCGGNSRRHTTHNKMASWSGGIKPRGC